MRYTILTMALAAASLPALAQAPDPTLARNLAATCANCHGTNGKGPGFDDIAGKSASELYRELKEFQSGDEGSGLMAKHAWGYTDAQLRALSQYLSRQR